MEPGVFLALGKLREQPHADRWVNVDDAPAGGAVFGPVGRDGKPATRQLTGYFGKLCIRP